MAAERYDKILALGVVILSRLSFFIGFHGVVFSSDFMELSEFYCLYDYSRNFIRIRPYGLWQIPHIVFSSFFPLSFASFSFPSFSFPSFLSFPSSLPPLSFASFLISPSFLLLFLFSLFPLFSLFSSHSFLSFLSFLSFPSFPSFLPLSSLLYDSMYFISISILKMCFEG